MQISAPFQAFICALIWSGNAFKRPAYLSKDQLPESHLLPAGSWQIQLPSPYGPLPPWMSLLGQALRSAQDCSSIHLSSCRHLLCAPEQTALPRGGSWGECPATAEGPTSPSSGSYSAAGPAQGGSLVLLEEEEGAREAAGVGRAGGVHGRRRAGARKSGEKMRSPAVLGPALKPALPRHLPQRLLFLHHLQKPAPFLSVIRGVLHEAFPESRGGAQPRRFHNKGATQPSAPMPFT